MAHLVFGISPTTQSLDRAMAREKVMTLRRTWGNGHLSADTGELDLDLRQLFALNILLQVVDGLLTYRGLQIGFREGNPIVGASIATAGSATTLMLYKSNACGLLLLLRRGTPPALGTRVLWWTAVCYVLLAVVPWLGKLLAFATSLSVVAG
jgi:uncharacterized protein DUF5658